jgi:membrane protein required for colicin V production
MIIDIIILIIMAVFFIMGVKRGLIQQALDILGIILAFLGAFYLAHYVAYYLEDSIELQYNISLVLSAVAIFIAILVFFKIMGIFLKKLADIALLGSLDRIGGGLFGLFKGVLLISLLLIIAFNIPLPDQYKKQIRERPLAIGIYPVLPSLFDLIFSHSPSDLNFDKVIRTDEYRRSLDAVREKADEKEKGMKSRKESLDKALKELDD